MLPEGVPPEAVVIDAVNVIGSPYAAEAPEDVTAIVVLTLPVTVCVYAADVLLA